MTDHTQRDELVRAMRAAGYVDPVDGTVPRWPNPGVSVWTMAEQLADAILAAGYRKVTADDATVKRTAKAIIPSLELLAYDPKNVPALAEALARAVLVYATTPEVDDADAES